MTEKLKLKSDKNFGQWKELYDNVLDHFRVKFPTESKSAKDSEVQVL